MRTSLPKSEIFSKANVHFIKVAKYSITSQSETSIIFNDGKIINKVLFVCSLFIPILALFYYIIAKQHQAVLTIIPVDGRFEVTGTGSTTKAQQDVNKFLSSLPLAS